MQISRTDPPAKRLFDFARRYYHWLFAAGAALLVLTRFVPAVYLSAINSDNTQIPLLFRDVVEQGHAARDWVWGGHSDVFPDVALVFLLEFILRDGLLCLQVASGGTLAAYVAVLVALYRQNGGPNAETFGAMLLLFFVLLMINFGVHDGMEFISISSMVLSQHTSIAITALGCFALCQRAVLKNSGGALWWVAALCFAASLSDDLFLVIFTAPVLATLVIARFLYPDKLRLFPPMAAGILIPSAAGHLLASRLSPFQIDPGPYTGFHAAQAAEAWHQFRLLCSPAAGGDFIIFVALDLLVILVATGLLVITLSKPAAKRIPLSLFMLVLFGACVIDCNWGAVILTGNFSGMLAARYVRLAMLLPIFLLLASINHLIPWSRGANRAAVAALSLAISACALFLIPPPGKYYRETQELVPIIRTVMEKEHIEAGLADYWYANMIAFFSRDAIPLRAIRQDGSIYRWVNTSEWYAGDNSSNKPPEFRMILMDNLNPDKIRQRYGSPAQIIPTLPGMDLWIYPEDKGIAYNPLFRTLSNGPSNEFLADGCTLPTRTGQTEGDSRVARAGRDRAEFLTGSNPYAHPAAGRYRISIFYTYLSAPAPDKLAGYEVVFSAGATSQTLDQQRIPFIDNSRHEFTREIDVPDDRRGAFQVCTRYYGSGDVSIDSLKIIYLGK